MYIIDYDYLDNLVKRTISEGMYSVEPMIGIMSKIILKKMVKLVLLKRNL